MKYELLQNEPKYELLPDEPSTEGYGSQIAKGAGQLAARTFETVAGLPGDLLSTFGGVGNYLTQWAPKPIKKYEDLQKELPISFPTSSQLREATQRLTGYTFEPKSELGKRASNVYETALSLVLPLGPLGKGLKVGTALKGAVTGEALSYLAKELGGSDKAQGVAKVLGTLGGTVAFQGRDLKNLSAKNYEEVQKSIAGKNIPADKLRGSIEKLWDKYTVGDSPAKKFAQERLLAVDGLINKGKIDAGSLYNLKKNANEHWATANKAERKVLKDLIDIEKDALKGIGSDYAKLQMADDIHKSFVQSNKAMSFIKDNIPGAVKLTPLVKGLFFGGSSLVGKLPVVAGSYATYRLADQANSIRKFLGTPSGLKYYGNVLKDGFSGNSRGVAKNIAKLNSASEKFEKEQSKYELLD